jgi:hypothetical protein
MAIEGGNQGPSRREIEMGPNEVVGTLLVGSDQEDSRSQTHSSLSNNMRGGRR